MRFTIASRELILRASHDAGVREYPAAFRARRACAGGTAGRECGAAASRKPVAAAAAGCRIALEERRIARGGRDRVARTRHRHRNGGSGRARSARRDRLRSRCSAIGRSGHWVGAKPKGRLFATTRDELIECAAIVSAIRKGDLERIEIPENALDILAQQIVAAAACEPGRKTTFTSCSARLIRTAISRARDFDAIVEMLSEGIATSRGRSGALLHRDQVNGRVQGRRGARLAAITSGGAIPENANYAVIAEPDGKTVGTLDEDFAVESLAGDVFLLGRIRGASSAWDRAGARGGCARRGAFHSVLAGRSAGPFARTIGGSVANPRERIVAIRSRFLNFSSTNAVWTKPAQNKSSRMSGRARQRWARCPRRHTVVAERFFDQAGGMQLVLHAPFGSRITRAWGLALRKRFCRTFNFELQAAATDNGLVLSLSEQHAFPLELVFAFLKRRNRGRRVAAGAADRADVRRALALEYDAARSRFCDSAAASACRRRFSACAPTICWRRFFPTRWPARRI